PEVLAATVARILAAWAVPGERITVVESIPGGDRVVWDRVCARAAAASGADGGRGGDSDDDEVGRALADLRLPRARFVPFQELWATGLPARPGQVWLTTRFHPHLFAAARGASGVALRSGSAYYDVKHGSLLAAGSRWTSVPADEDPRSVVSGVPAAGGIDPAAVAALVEGAERLAREIYRPGR